MLQEWIDAYYEFEKKNEDPRTKGWFLVRSPFDGIFICLSYVIFVTLIGPRLMKNREPFNIRPLMVVYNFGIVILSAYMVYLFITGGWLTTYSFGCQVIDKSTSPAAMNMVLASYLFYVSKYVEFLDTIFFILRKKFHLITVLHVWHHGVMPWSWYTAPKFSPGGMGTFAACLNSAVHVCMYTYYGIAALGPEYKKYIWWKKYLTSLQIVQFVAIIAHASQSFFIECDFPAWINYWLICFSGSFLVLFLNYYVQEYFKRRKRAAVNKQKSKLNGHENNGVYYTNGTGQYDKKKE